MACLENAHRNGHWVREGSHLHTCPPFLKINLSTETRDTTGDPEQYPPHAALAPPARAEARRARAGEPERTVADALSID